MTIAKRIWLIVLIMVIGLLGLLGTSLVQMRVDLMAERKEKIHDFTELAKSLVATYQAQVASGALTLNEAQTRVLGRIAGITYGQDGYVWVHRLSDGVILTHPVKHFIGKNFSEVILSNGRPLFEEFSRLIHEHGEGYVKYPWPRPNKIEPEQKLSFIIGVPDWDWVIGSGAYISDIDQAFRERALNLGGLGLTISLLVSIIATFFARDISRPLSKVTEAIDALSYGHVNPDIQFKNRSDEVGTLARAMVNLNNTTIAMNEWREKRKSLRLQAENERRDALTKMAVTFEQSVHCIVQKMANATKELQSIVNDVSDAEEECLDVIGVKAALELDLSATTTKNNEVSTPYIDFMPDRDHNVEDICVRLHEAHKTIGEIVHMIGQLTTHANLHALSLDRLHEHVKSADGPSDTPRSIIVLRKLTGKDAEAYREHLLRLDVTSRASRFCTNTTDKAIHKYVESFNWNRDSVIGYYSDDLIRATAEITYSSPPSPIDAELAFSVENEYQNSGIGTKMMTIALHAVYNRGVRTAHVICHARNGRMRKIALHNGGKANFDNIDDEFVAAIDVPMSEVGHLLANLGMWQ